MTNDELEAYRADRAERAEAHAERLASALEAMVAASVAFRGEAYGPTDPTTNTGIELSDKLIEARQALAAHRGDTAALEGE